MVSEPIDPSTIQETRTEIELRGVDSLEVNDLTEEDLPLISWSGGPCHSKAVEQALKRVEIGQVDYLAVRAPDGYPVSIGGVDCAKQPGAGNLWQLRARAGILG